MIEVRPKILCLGFWSPPMVRPRAILLGKIIPEWIKQGIDPIIVTYENNGEWDTSVPLVKIGHYEAKGKTAIGRVLSEFFYYHKNLKTLKILIAKEKIDLIFSFANPQASNIFGAMIKKRMDIPFVSHFSDPWYDNPYKKFSGLGKRKVLFLENYIIKNSNKVVFTNKQALDLVMRKYPLEWEKKGIVIPHCYNKTDYSKSLKKEKDKIVFSYIGAFYKDRNPKMIFEVISSLVQKNKSVKDKFKFILVGCANKYAGYSEEHIRIDIQKYGLEENIEIIPVVDHKTSLYYIESSDYLLVVDANFPNSPFLPSKIVDYAGSRNIIIGITPRGSPTEEFLENLGYKSFNYKQKNELEAYLKELIEGTWKAKINESFLERFDVRNTTAKIVDVFKALIEDNRRDWCKAKLMASKLANFP